MRLNLGCGDHKAPSPWVNVDAWAGARPDVLADLRMLPWDDHAASSVYCGHVLEHLTPPDATKALREVRRVLRSDGSICVVGPDHDRANGVEKPDKVLLHVIRDGGDRWPGDRHLWLSTETATLDLVRQTFPNATPVPIADLPECWPAFSHVWWQFAIVATKET